MPEILTMIQVKRLTPAPAVLIMALLSMLYLMSSDIFALINYVGFATWVSNLKSLASYWIVDTNEVISLAVEHRRVCPLRAMAPLGST